jgi:hypothetical protein
MPIEESEALSFEQNGKGVYTENMMRRDPLLHGGKQTVEQEEEAASSVESLAPRTVKEKRCKSEKRDKNSSQAVHKGQWSRHQRDSPDDDTLDDSRKRAGRESWPMAAPKMPKRKGT